MLKPYFRVLEGELVVDRGRLWKIKKLSEIDFGLFFILRGKFRITLRFCTMYTFLANPEHKNATS